MIQKQFYICFFYCDVSRKFWNDVSAHFFDAVNSVYSFTLKDVICHYTNSEDQALEHLLNFVILYAKFFIHKQKYAKSLPKITPFLLELNSLLKSLNLVNNKKSNTSINHY